MNMKKSVFWFILIFIAILVSHCTNRNRQDDIFLPDLLKKNMPKFAGILNNPEKFRLQILYTCIDRDSLNQPHFHSFQYHVNNREYFYPASTVKLPVAVLALEKINLLNIPGLNKYTSMRIDSAYSGQSREYNDSTASNNLPSIAHFIKKIFLVSDNDAFNRLYEFLGQQYINRTLWAKGYTDVRIIRRLESGLSTLENRATNPITFFENDRTLYHQPVVINPETLQVKMKGVKQGIGYYRNGELVHHPIDFSYSNYLSVPDLQNILKAVIYPDPPDSGGVFDLTADDYRFLYTYMSMLPRQSEITAYRDTTEYPDGYLKFFMYLNSRQIIPSNIRIFNKSGQAYGYLIDNAYIIDLDKKVEFLLTAVIQVNENRIYNDDTYEYDEIGLPFLAELGRVIYDYESDRERPCLPNLNRFMNENP